MAQCPLSYCKPNFCFGGDNDDPEVQMARVQKAINRDIESRK